MKGFEKRARPGHRSRSLDDASRFEGGAQIDFVADEEVRRRPAVFEGRDEPKGDVRRRREIEARPIQALAGLSALRPGHFAAFLNLTPAPSPFSSTKITPADSTVDSATLEFDPRQ